MFHSTAIEAVNRALVTLGQDVTIDELSTTSPSAHARKCAFLYDGARLKVLGAHPWSFARRELTINGLSSLSPTADVEGLTYETPIPPSCLRVLACYGCDNAPIKYRRNADLIRSRAPISRIVYIENEEDLDRWSPEAYRALVLRLAADLAKPITGRINERQMQESAYTDQLDAAKFADARESNTEADSWGDDYYVRARNTPRQFNPFNC